MAEQLIQLVSSLSLYNNCIVHLFSPKFLKFPERLISELEKKIEIYEHELSEMEKTNF